MWNSSCFWTCSECGRLVSSCAWNSSFFFPPSPWWLSSARQGAPWPMASPRNLLVPSPFWARIAFSSSPFESRRMSLLLRLTRFFLGLFRTWAVEGKAGLGRVLAFVLGGGQAASWPFKMDLGIKALSSLRFGHPKPLLDRPLEEGPVGLWVLALGRLGRVPWFSWVLPWAVYAGWLQEGPTYPDLSP